MPPTEAIIYVNATIFRPRQGCRKAAKTENKQAEKKDRLRCHVNPP